LGNRYYQQKRFQKARAAFEAMVLAIERLRAASSLRADREKMVSDYASAIARLVFCCLVENDFAAAFRYAEAGKSRALVDALQGERQRLEDIGIDDPDLQEKIGRAQSLRQQIDRLLVELGQSTGEAQDENRAFLRPSAEIQQDLADSLREEDALWKAIEKDHPAFAITVSAPPFKVSRAQTLAQSEGTVLVSYYQHAEGWVAFVVTGESFDTIPLSGVESLANIMLRYLPDLSLFDGRNPNLINLLQRLHAIFIEPLLPYLPMDNKRLMIAPYGLLHLLPLGAALNPHTEHYLAEDCTLRIVPSLGTIDAIIREAQKNQDDGDLPYELLAVAYPGSEDEKDALYLDNVIPESEEVVGLFSKVKLLIKEQATPQAVLGAHRDAHILHFGCHGWFNPQHPESSGLLLKDGWLTARQVIARMDLHNADLVMLGACLSGKQRVAGGDELTGLITAFVAARARAVVGTLWSVDDAATACLMKHFYAGVRAGFPLDEALSRAQAVVRSQPGWESPYFWAAFFLTGLSNRAGEGLNALVPVAQPFAQQLELAPATRAGFNQRKGKGMSATSIFKEVNFILRQIKDFPQVMEERLIGAECDGLYDLVARLGIEVESAGEDPAAFLTEANAFLTTIENTPAYKNFFCPSKTDAQIKRLQIKRKINLGQEISDRNHSVWKAEIENSVREIASQAQEKEKKQKKDEKKNDDQ
jgi:CHAT domain-containing protein